jgi:hypothetical protein
MRADLTHRMPMPRLRQRGCVRFSVLSRTAIRPPSCSGGEPFIQSGSPN